MIKYEKVPQRNKQEDETENTIKVPAGLIQEDHGKFLTEE